MTSLLAIAKLGNNLYLCGQHVRWNRPGMSEQYTAKVGRVSAGPLPRENFCTAAACCYRNNVDEMEITNTTLHSNFMTVWPS